MNSQVREDLQMIGQSHVNTYQGGAGRGGRSVTNQRRNNCIYKLSCDDNFLPSLIKDRFSLSQKMIFLASMNAFNK